MQVMAPGSKAGHRDEAEARPTQDQARTLVIRMDSDELITVFQNLRKHQTREARLILWLLSAFVAILMVFFRPPPVPATAVVTLWVTLVATYCVVVGAENRDTTIRLKKIGEIRSEYRFSKRGIFLRQTDGVTRIPWSAVSRILRLRDHWYLMLRSGGSFWLPLRAMSDDLRDYLEKMCEMPSARGAECRSCGFNLQGQVNRKCPECGRDF